MRAQGIELIGDSREVAGEAARAKALDAQLAAADAMVFLVDPAAKEDRALEYEWSAAVEHSWAMPGKPMIPVLIGDAEPPPFLRDRVALRVPSSDELEEVAGPLVSILKDRKADSAGPKAGAEAEAREDQQRTRLNEIREGAERLDAQDDRKERVAALEAQLEAARAAGADAAAIADLEMRLADALRADGRYAEAVSCLGAAAARLRELAGDEAQGDVSQGDAARGVRARLARVELNLARSLEKLERLEEAAAHWREGLNLYEKLEGRDSLVVSFVHLSLASLYDRLGEASQAAGHREAAAAIARKQLARLAGWLSKLPVIGGIFSRFRSAKAIREGGETRGGGKE